jgi:branched-chain amino acid transport system ATP-binding protein
LRKPLSGTITFDGDDITGMPIERLVRSGLILCPSGRHVFARSSVEFNLEMGAYALRDRAQAARDLTAMYDRFPILADHRRDLAGQLSGGQQQLVAIARALMGRPRLLLMDEPSMGLAPRAATDVFAVIESVKAEGMTIMLAEQNVRKALLASDTAYVIDNGVVSLGGRASDLMQSEDIKDAFLGGSPAGPSSPAHHAQSVHHQGK